MRIIVSVKYLRKQIKDVLSKDPKTFTIADNVLKFDDGSNQDIVFTHLFGQDNRKYKGFYIYTQWKNMYEFLDQLEDQPIVLNFAEYSNVEIHEIPGIEFLQFIKRF